MTRAGDDSAEVVGGPGGTMVRMAPARPVRIHLPWTAVIIPLMLFVCITPLATAGGAWIVLYVFPAALLIGLMLAGSTATGTALTARWAGGWTRLAWDQVQQLEFAGQRWAVAVTTDGRRVTLPGVRPADLPRIVQAAGGRLFLQRPVSAPAGETSQPAGGAPGQPGGVSADPGASEPSGTSEQPRASGQPEAARNHAGAVTDAVPAAGQPASPAAR
jgi:hypothetical protein